MIELVWDSRRVGTATSGSGASVTVGEDASFAPDDLIAAAAAACLMRTFLCLADEAGIPVLSYAATATVEPPRETTPRVSPRVTVRSYVVAPSGVVGSRLLDLYQQAARSAPIARLLGDRLTAHLNLRVLCSIERAAG